MGSSYYRWSTDSAIPLFLQLTTPAQAGATGLSPEVAIRRARLLDGTVLDGWYWDGAGFSATPQWHTLAEYDAVNAPGLYVYDWEQNLVGASQIYLVYYRHTVAPIGFAIEEHVVSDELFIPSSSPAVPVIPGDTVMGRLAAMEDPLGDVAQANADAVWDEALGAHLLPGSTGEALAQLAAGQVGARQIDITVEDGGSNPIQGATVDVFDITNTVHLFRTYTDTLGQVSVALDDGTYNVRLFASGYAFTVPEVLTVTADAAVTYAGTALGTIIPPTNPDHCIIYGAVDNAAGTPIPGACVEAFADTPQVVAGFQKSERVASTLTDVDGNFQLELVQLTEVRFVITDPDGETVLEILRTVPAQPTQDLASWT